MVNISRSLKSPTNTRQIAFNYKSIPVGTGFTIHRTPLHQLDTPAGSTAPIGQTSWFHCTNWTHQLASLRQLDTLAGSSAPIGHTSWLHCTNWTHQLAHTRWQIPSELSKVNRNIFICETHASLLPPTRRAVRASEQN